jgi:hypothetical protein
VGRICLRRAKEREQIVDVRSHCVPFAAREVVVRPGVPAAVGNRAKSRSDGGQLPVPGREIADRAVDKHHRLACADRTIGKRRSAHVGQGEIVWDLQATHHRHIMAPLR